jgi:hypothetical protein
MNSTEEFRVDLRVVGFEIITEQFQACVPVHARIDFCMTVQAQMQEQENTSRHFRCSQAAKEPGVTHDSKDEVFALNRLLVMTCK